MKLVEPKSIKFSDGIVNSSWKRSKKNLQILYPQIVAHVTEFEIAITSQGGFQQNIVKCGDLFIVPKADGILFYKANGKYRIITLPIPPLSQCDALVLEDKLIIAGLNYPGCKLFEFQITSWSDELPLTLQLTNNFNYGSEVSRWTRLLKLRSDAVMLSVSRHNERNQDILYRISSGEWINCSLPAQPDAGLPTNHYMAQGAGGIIYIFSIRDGSGQFHLHRWIESNGILSFLDSQLMPLTNYMSPEVEYPQMVLETDLFNPNRILLTYPTVADSQNISEICPDYYRIAHPIILAVDTIAQPDNAVIINNKVDYQNLYITWAKTPGLIYEPQASRDLKIWQKLQEWNRTETENLISISAVNPAFSTVDPWETLFLRVKAMSYKLNLLSVVYSFVERATHWLPVFPKSATENMYLVNPIDINSCSQSQWFQGISSSEELTPVDYQPFAWGNGWTFIQRNNKYFLKYLM